MGPLRWQAGAAGANNQWWCGTGPALPDLRSAPAARAAPEQRPCFFERGVRPLAMFSAANRLVVPCRTVARSHMPFANPDDLSGYALDTTDVLSGCQVDELSTCRVG